MTSPSARPARPLAAALLIGLAAVLVALDIAGSTPIDPLAAPAPAALGSGAAPSGAHCTQG